MTTLEKILQKEFDSNPNNEPFDEMYIGEFEAIKKAMQIYAAECCKATLEKASEIMYEYNRDDNPQEASDLVCNPKNIVLL